MTTKEKMRRKAAAKAKRMQDESRDLVAAANTNEIIADTTEVFDMDKDAELVANEMESEAGPDTEPSVNAFTHIRSFLIWLGVLVEVGLITLKDGVVSAWIKFDKFMDRNITALYKWAYSKKQAVKAWREARKQTMDYVSRAELMACMEALTTKFATELKKSQSVQHVDPTKLDALLSAIHDGHNTKAAKYYTALTGATLGQAKAAIEMYA